MAVHPVSEKLHAAFDRISAAVAKLEADIAGLGIPLQVSVPFGDDVSQQFGWKKLGDRWRLVFEAEGHDRIALADTPVQVRLDALLDADILVTRLINEAEGIVETMGTLDEAEVAVKAVLTRWKR